MADVLEGQRSETGTVDRWQYAANDNKESTKGGMCHGILEYAKVNNTWEIMS